MALLFPGLDSRDDILWQHCVGADVSEGHDASRFILGEHGLYDSVSCFGMLVCWAVGGTPSQAILEDSYRKVTPRP